MDKSEKLKAVKKAEKEAEERYGKEIFYMFSTQQRLAIIRELLPTEPIYGETQLYRILYSKNKKRK